MYPIVYSIVMLIGAIGLGIVLGVSKFQIVEAESLKLDE